METHFRIRPFVSLSFLFVWLVWIFFFVFKSTKVPVLKIRNLIYAV